MKVYVAWDDSDYYGPDPMADHVYASLQAAQRGVEADRFATKGGEWKQRHRYGTEPLSWEYTKGSYWIEEVEVVE